MADLQDVRLRILAVLIPVASRHGITDPASLIETAGALEKYVVGSAASDVTTPDTSNRGTLKLPRKEKQTAAPPEFLTPPMVDKSNQAPG